MEGVIPAVVQVVGVAREVPAAALPRLRLGLGALSFSWKDGPLRFEGQGEAVTYAGAQVAEVLAAATRCDVRVSGACVPPPAPWFCGFAFDGGAPRDAWWESFPAARALLPRLLLAEGPAGASLTAFQEVRGQSEGEARARAEEALQAAFDLPARTGHPEDGRPKAVLREDGAAWESLVQRALEELRSGMLRKVVLARALDVAAERPFDVPSALARAESQAHGAVVYALRAADGTSFVGASPEQLLRVQGRRFWTQALAGSAAPAEAERLARSPKEVREHAAVVEDVRAALDGVAEQLEVADVTSVSLGYVTHLDARITGLLAASVTPVQAALALHPTAAVSGAPRDRARAFLRAHERLARGWYAGAVGWVGAEAADLRVALRCALVRGAAARLFVGAGVVEGSTSAAEWEETRRKASPMLHALLGDRPWPR